MVLSGERLSRKLGSYMKPYNELDARSRNLIDVAKAQRLGIAGSVLYPALKKPVLIPFCTGAHIAVIRDSQDGLVKRLLSGKMIEGLPPEKIKGDYTHIIVDVKGNVHLVDERELGRMARAKGKLGHFYLVKTPVDKEGSGRAVRRVRGAQRRIRRYWKRLLRPLKNRPR